MYNDQFTKHDEVGTVRHEADNTEQDGHTPAAEQESDHDAAAKSSEIRSISTIKWFSVNKGFGFIQPNGGDEEVFIHQANVSNRDPDVVIRQAWAPVQDHHDDFLDLEDAAPTRGHYQSIPRSKQVTQRAGKKQANNKKVKMRATFQRLQ